MQQRQEQLYTIGQAAKICRIPIQTLRYYDQIGIVVPASVDEQNGYRYYGNRELLLIKIVQDLRSMEFSLEEIAEIAQAGDIGFTLERMKRKQEEAKERIRTLTARVEAMDKRIELMEVQLHLQQSFAQGEGYVEMKYFDDRHVLSERSRGPAGMEPYTKRFVELFHQAERRGLEPEGLIMTVYYDDWLEVNYTDSDTEVCIPIAANSLSSADRGEGLRVIREGWHLTGSYRGISGPEVCKRLYGSMLAWMEEQGYRPDGLVMEQYIVDLSRMIDPEEFIIELQIPIARR
ncbi:MULTISPECIES: MerR family transcriptional regulator [unclassified Paenibacillus]|uniref:MerR family transcriptional regulator n=1 Tax=unclassified Paenibacillus TaxID=185978 RepID=UPI000930F818|nr:MULTISPECIES: MerR family transcriptional regulator [unclassified Paenibacillus]